MSIRKRNEFLENDESEDELDGYHSDTVEESRARISERASKRRRLEPASDEESFRGISDTEEAGLDASTVSGVTAAQPAAEELDTENEDADIFAKGSSKPKLKTSTPKQVEAAQKAARKSGVVYISRVPPFMKPQTLKHFLAPHARKGIGRLFLTPEDHVAHTRRVKSGGNKKKSFTDGWVEFTSKREAKIAAETLNGNIIGGKKGNFYHDDLWSMKYLKGFKWSHLTEQIANENAERAARMREEVRRTRQENKAFVEDIEKGKMLQTKETKRKAKLERGGVHDAGKVKPPEFSKGFKQKAARGSQRDEQESAQASRVQRMIF